MKKTILMIGAAIFGLLAITRADLVTSPVYNPASALQAQTGNQLVNTTNGVLVNPTVSGQTNSDLTANAVVMTDGNKALTSTAITALGFPTNTANCNTVTNDLAANAWTLLRGQRSTVTISLTGTGGSGGLWYSNAATGKTPVYYINQTGTNTVTIRANPNSMVAPSNCAVMLNATEIDYE